MGQNKSNAVCELVPCSSCCEREVKKILVLNSNLVSFLHKPRWVWVRWRTDCYRWDCSKWDGNHLPPKKLCRGISGWSFPCRWQWTINLWILGALRWVLPWWPMGKMHVSSLKEQEAKCTQLDSTSSSGGNKGVLAFCQHFSAKK